VIGGSELEAQRVSSTLIRRGYRVTVVCAGGHPMPPLRDWVDPAGVPVRIYASAWSGAMKDVVFAVRLMGMLLRDRRRYDLVYFLMQGLQLAVGLPVARLLRKPILMKIAGSGVIPMLTHTRTGRLELRWLRKWAHRVMVLNGQMRDEAVEEGFPPDQLYWMPNPVDTDEFAPATPERRLGLRVRLGLPAGVPVVLSLGRLAPEKSLELLIDAFARVWQRAPQSVLVFVGDGAVRKDLEAQAGRLGLPAANVRFAGQVTPTEVPLWLQAADLYTLVSFREGFPCALLEAMSVGLASVVTDIPANRQLIDDGRHGVLVHAGDAEAIGDAILRLVEAPSARREMGAAARERVLENYSLDKVADRYEALLHEAVESGRRTSSTPA
jgi:glycosyltransferase involved in cell wall biosynthesis